MTEAKYYIISAMNRIVDTTPFYKRFTYILVSLSLLGAILYIGQGILKPVLFAILLSVLLLPVVNFFRRIKLNRFVSILITLLISSAAILGILYFISRQVFSFLDDFDGIQKRLDVLYTSLQLWVKNEFGVTIAKQDEYIHDTGDFDVIGFPPAFLKRASSQIPKRPLKAKQLVFVVSISTKVDLF